MHMWKVGDLAVCIKDDWLPHDLVRDWPVKNCVYTLREIVLIPVRGEDHLAFLLEEIINEKGYFLNEQSYTVEYLEVAFSAEKFRPVKKTSLGSLNSLLNTGPVEKKSKILENV